MVEIVHVWDEEGEMEVGCAPLPTHPQRHCDPASLVCKTTLLHFLGNQVKKCAKSFGDQNELSHQNILPSVRKAFMDTMLGVPRAR